MSSGARELAVGLDVGTQGTKAVAVDISGSRVVARASARYDLIPGLGPGAAEQHPETWAGAVREVLAQLAAQDVRPREVASVGVSGQQHGLVLLDAEGEVVRPAKLWCDTSTAAEAAELGERFGAPVPVGFTASKVAWVQRHEPGAWARTRTVMLPHDFINFRLTGERRMETGDASGTGFFDVEKRAFDDERIGLIGGDLAGRLPSLIEAPGMAGRVSAEGAAWSGLAEGTPVSAGGGDNMMSAIGSGAIAPGVVVISLGTSATAFAHSDSPVVDPGGLIAPFCGSSGGWLPLLCTMNATGVVEEVRAALRREHAELTELASRVEPGSGGLVWLPFHIGERVPDLPGATGTLTGIRPGWLDPGRLYRASIEAVSANLCWGIDRLGALGISVQEARLVGGGANNPLWIQILADMLNTPVTPMREPESAALGAALQAAWSAGSDRSREGLSAIVARLTARGETVRPSDAVEAYADFRGAYAEQLRLRHAGV
jgi:xylulokinase